MKINFYATLRQIVGQKTIELELPGQPTVWDVVELVIQRYPPLQAQLLDENGDLYQHVHVFIDGRDAPYLENGLETVLRGSEKIDIFPAVGGGQEDQVRLERDLCGLPLWLMQDYLVELGGVSKGPGQVVGNGWVAHLTQLEDYCVGSLAVGQIRVEIEGTAQAMDALMPGLEKKLLRAGG
jgi:molybdopterin synthase sulfur carrier subunit